MVDDRHSVGRVVFISRAGENREVALRIDQILRDTGYRTYIQDNDFGHTSFMAGMAKGFEQIESDGLLLALLSDIYQKKPHCLKEARFPLIDDPSNEKQRLVVLRIDSCRPRDFLKDIPYVDLGPHLDDIEALEERILAAVQTAFGANKSTANDAAQVPIEYVDPKLERLILYLENEGQIEHGKAILAIVCLIFVLGIGFIAFDYAVDVWNRVFGKSYYAIFDTSYVMIMWSIMTAGLIFGIYSQVSEIARTIENAHLSSAQLRALRARVSQVDWQSKWLIDAAITKATRNITARRF